MLCGNTLEQKDGNNNSDNNNINNITSLLGQQIDWSEVCRRCVTGALEMFHAEQRGLISKRYDENTTLIV